MTPVALTAPGITPTHPTVAVASPLVVPPLFFWVLDRRFVRREEIFLRGRFGAAFDEYCGRVRRWL